MTTEQHPITPPPELMEQWWEEADKQLSTYSDLLARPKPLGLAEQATAKLDEAVMRGDCISTTTAMPILRAALRRLQELEKGNE